MSVIHEPAAPDFPRAHATIAPDGTVEGYASLFGEIAAEDRLQRWWRPLYALELSLLECPAFALTLLHALWLGHEAGINGFANLSALLMTYFGARFGVLGVYVTGRTREKGALLTGHATQGIATQGIATPGVLGQVVKAVVKKR